MFDSQKNVVLTAPRVEGHYYVDCAVDHGELVHGFEFNFCEPHVKVKVKSTMPLRGVGEVLISLS